MHSKTAFGSLTFLTMAMLAGAVSAHGQAVPAVPTAGPARRITQAIDESQLVRLSGNTHPLARPENDLGPAPADLPMQHMLLVLAPSAAQQAALQNLLVQQQALGSPLYHQWLTPSQFAAQFGVSSGDLATLTGWLAGHGFTIDEVSPGGTRIEFSGTAAQVENGLHTEMHRYTVGGKSYWANNADPEIPAALSGVVAGVDSLDNFPRHSNLRRAGQGIGHKATDGVPGPALTFPCSSNTMQPGYDPDCNDGVAHAIVPADFAKIYNVTPLYSAAVTGAGQSIAVVGRVDINLADVANFRALFLPGYATGTASTTTSSCGSGVQTCMIINGADPGIWDEDEETEADLDVEWAGAIAPNTTVDFVSSGSTDATDGIDLSAQYIVDRNLAPVMTSSFGLCEAALGEAGNEFYDLLYEQAAAQGISVVVAAGDQGSEACDQDDTNSTIAEYGLGVNGLASTPFNVAAGGTLFNDNDGSTTYWNDIQNNTLNYSSALGYIPEQAWNESCGLAACGGYLAAGGGGVSQVYPKPLWQSTSITGMPNDGARDLPDVSLAAAAYDGYVLCQTDVGATCSGVEFPFQVVGGTSAAAPSFASILALVNQKTSSIQGVADVYLYGLAAKETYSGCNFYSSPGSAAGSSCVFLDTVNGNDAVPCVTGTPNCGSAGTTATDGAVNSFGADATYSPACGETATGATAYNAVAGYDCATGLGTVNVANLVNNWSSVTLSATTTSLSLTPTTMTHGQAVTATVSVGIAGSGQTNGIAGDVALLAQPPAPLASVDDATLGMDNGFGTCGSNCVKWELPSTDDVSALPGGTYNIYARYAGGNGLASSISAVQQVTVAPEPSVTTAYAGYQINGSTGLLAPAATVPYGTPVYLKGFVCNSAGQSGSGGCNVNDGIPTGTITFTDNGATPVGLSGLNVVALSDDAYSTAVGPGTYPPDAAFPQTPLLALAVGTHSLVGAYSGDASFKASTSAADNFTVAQAATAIAITSDTTGSNDNATLVAEVSTASLGAAPSGTITFYSGTTQIGNPVTVSASYIVANGCTGPGAGGCYNDATGSVTATLPAGSDSITAVYSGDANYATSTSSAVTLNVGNNNFNLAVSNSSETVAPGSTATDLITVTSAGSFNSPVALSCAIAGTPSGASCSVTPASVTPAAGGIVTASAAITTTAASSLAPPPPGRRSPWLPLALLALFALLATMNRATRRLAPLALLGGALLLAGCGGSSPSSGGNNNNGGGTTTGGTPAGSYSVTVTGTSGGITNVATFNLVVQ